MTPSVLTRQVPHEESYVISMKTRRPLSYDFGTFLRIPGKDRRAGERNGPLLFIQSMACDRWYEHHLVNCDTPEELVELFRLYEKRVNAPFPMFEADFEQIARDTWRDAKYQAARRRRANR